MSRPSQGHFPPGSLRTVALGGLLALVLSGFAQAQTYESQGEGLTIGHFVFHPAISYEYTYDSNILFISDDLPGSDPIASGINLVRARLLANLPIRDGRIRFVYAPFYRSYTNDRFRPEDGLNHEFDLEGMFPAGRSITVTFRDHYVNGTVSLQEQLDRSGLPVGLGHYTTHDPQLEIDVSLGARQGFSLLPSYSRSSYNGLVSSLGQVVDYGYTTRALEGRYNYRHSEPTTVYGYHELADTTETITGAPEITIQSRATGLGFMRTTNENLVTQLSVGYQTLDFEGGSGQNFSGPVGEANVTWQLENLARINFRFLRKPYASIFADSYYYLETAGRIGWIRQIGRKNYMDAGAALEEQEYVPAQGTARIVRLIRLEGGVGHQFLNNLRAYVGLNLEQSESNVLQLGGGAGADPYHYKLFRIVFRLEAGWL